MNPFLKQTPFFTLSGLTVLLLISGCQDPAIPDVLHVLESAKHRIEEAKRRGATTFAPELLGLAESELVIGEKEFQTQENHVFWGRDFSLALRLANLAQLDAEKALSIAENEQLVPHPSDPPPPQAPQNPLETLM